MQHHTRMIVFEPDLLFSSKIEGIAARLGFAVTVMTDWDGLLSKLGESIPPVLVVNLDALDRKIVDLMGFVRGKPCTTLGYYSHVNVQLAEEAHKVGFDIILPRGAFVARMEKTLRDVFAEE